jgi:hypothetical protein
MSHFRHLIHVCVEQLLQPLGEVNRLDPVQREHQVERIAILLVLDWINVKLSGRKDCRLERVQQASEG